MNARLDQLEVGMAFGIERNDLAVQNDGIAGQFLERGRQRWKALASVDGRLRVRISKLSPSLTTSARMPSIFNSKSQSGLSKGFVGESCEHRLDVFRQRTSVPDAFMPKRSSSLSTGVNQ